MAELLAGLSIGLAAGISPGPLQALVVTSTARSGFGAGWRVAAAPLLTDAPIVTIALFAVGSLPEGWVRGLALIGGVIVIAFGLWELRFAHGDSVSEEPSRAGSRALWQGALVNAINPHPWVFWIAAGAPALIRAWRLAPWRGAAFVAGFYVTLIGSKVALAAVVAAGRHRITNPWRRRLIIAGGLLLIVGGLILVLQAV